MTDKKSSESRRKLLKTIAAGSGAIVAGKNLPESWSKPVVDSVLLPVHAQTSDPSPSGPFSYHFQDTFTGWLDNGNNSLFAKVTDSLLPKAEAQVPIIVDYCVDTFANGTWRAAIRSMQNGILRQIWWTPEPAGQIGGGPVTMSGNICIDHPPVTFEVTTANSNTAQVIIKEDGTQAGPTIIPIGNCPFGDPTDINCPD